MRQPPRLRPAALLACLGLWVAGGARAASGPGSADPARFATIDTTALSGTMPAVPGAAGLPAAGLVMQARAQALRPAPLPDPDLEAPGPGRQALASQEEASLQPNFFGKPKPFSGDGFAPGSTLDDGHANRRRPGGGMSLSIPMP